MQTFLLTALSLFIGTVSAQTGRDYAVFFYVTDFQPGWQRLPETADEALKLKAELETNFGFSVKLVPNPTRRQILDELRAWNDRLGPTDQALYFFSMHGYYDRAGDRGYLVPADGKTLKLDPYFDTWLSYDDLRTNFARCPARHLLVAFDACYSGAFGLRMKSPDEPVYDEKADCATRRAFPFQYRSRQFLTSGNAETKTPARSLFADKLLETLRKAPQNDGLVFFDDLLYALGKIPTPRPEGGTFGAHEAAGGFVFARRDACAGVGSNTDLASWNRTKTLNTLTAYEQYIKDFPQGDFREAAEAKIDSFKKAAVKTPADTATKPAATTPAEAIPAGFVLVRGGTFKMGSEHIDAGPDEKPVHDVTLSDFYIAKYEVTQAEWRRVMGSDPPDLAFPGCDQCPVESVSWNDVQEYLQKLNAQSDGKYRLPTEAEWEYAAQGGAQSRNYLYAGSNNIEEVAWYSSNSDRITHQVGQKKANELGLYDMTGNVWEWCADWKGDYSNSIQYNPTGPPLGSGRVLRGGAKNYGENNCRVARRHLDAPSVYNSNIGFRLARTF